MPQCRNGSFNVAGWGVVSVAESVGWAFPRVIWHLPNIPRRSVKSHIEAMPIQWALGLALTGHLN
jgi:hypothetical protein